MMTDISYSRVSTLAVLSAAMGIASLSGFVAAEAAIVALPAIVVGCFALCMIRKYELRGRRYAILGIVVALLCASITPVWHIVQYNSESLSGYQRLDFPALASAHDNSLEHALGQQVCLKGYVSPGVFLKRSRFTLSADGNIQKSESCVLIQIPEGNTWQWNSNAVAVSGVLVHNPQFDADQTSPKFLLKQSVIRPSKTRFGLAHRVRNNRDC